MIFIRVKRLLMKLWLSSLIGVVLKGNINTKGLPIIQVVKGGNVILHNNVTLNSSNKGYFLNMHSPVKFCVSKSKARIVIGENSRIHGTCIHAYESVEIGENCLVAANCQIFDTNRHELNFENPKQRLKVSTKTKPVHIGDNVWIGANSIVLPGVKIGEGSVIAAGSIVTKDVPSFSLFGGNPAKRLRN